MPDDMQKNLVRLEKRTHEEIYTYANNQTILRREGGMRRKGQSMPVHADANQEQ